MMELLRYKRPNVIGAPAIIHDSIKLSGIVQAFVRRADCPDVNKLVFEDKNAININLKTFLRNTMDSSVDNALDNLRVAQSATPTAGDDGIMIYDHDTTLDATSNIGIMAMGDPPTTGNYYQEWQGTWQEPSANETVKSAALGWSNDGADEFDVIYATENINPDVVLVLNDILTINWRISIG